MSYRLPNPKSLLGLLALGVLAGGALGMWNRWHTVRGSSHWIVLAPRESESAPPLQEDPPKCRQWLQQAQQRLRRMPALAARIRIRAKMFGRRMLGTGRYWQAPAPGEKKPFLQTRFQWALQQGSQAVHWQQVCDGRFLWTMTRYPHKRRLTRVDLAEVMPEVARMPPSSAAAAELQVPYGLAGWLQQLQQSCRFTHWQPARIQSVPMLALYGTWRPETLAPLVKDPQGLFAGPLPMDSDLLPAHLPQQVVVYLSRKELFPFRIDFRRGRGEEEKIQVVLEFFQLQVSPQVDPALFTYRPGRLRVQDETQRVLGRLRRASRRAEDETRR